MVRCYRWMVLLTPIISTLRPLGAFLRVADKQRSSPPPLPGHFVLPFIDRRLLGLLSSVPRPALSSEKGFFVSPLTYLLDR